MLWKSLKIPTRAICKEYGFFFNISDPVWFFFANVKLLQIIVQMFLQWENNIFSSSNFLIQGRL